MKRYICVLMILVLSLMAFPSMSEELTPAQSAKQYIEGISAYFQVLAQKNGDEDTGILTAACAEKMYQVSIALSVLRESEYTVTDANDTRILHAQNVKFAGHLNDYTITIGQEYLSIQMQSKSEAGELLHSIAIEAGRKNGSDAMLLMLDYENAGALSSTCRYLIHTTEQTAESLFTRTLGETVEVKFDLAKWMAGSEYEWHRTLLFPEL